MSDNTTKPFGIEYLEEMAVFETTGKLNNGQGSIATFGFQPTYSGGVSEFFPKQDYTGDFMSDY